MGRDVEPDLKHLFPTRVVSFQHALAFSLAIRPLGFSRAELQFHAGESAFISSRVIAPGAIEMGARSGLPFLRDFEDTPNAHRLSQSL